MKNKFNNCLIGHTGTIGKNLNCQSYFRYKYNSKNFHKLKNKFFDLTICCAAPGSMTFANKYPDSDFKNIKKLIKNLKKIKTRKFVLISTIQVFSKLNDETNFENSKKLNNKLPYGKNRRFLEKFCEKFFSNFLIIRLPTVFGKFLKKNFLYDIKNPIPSFLFYEKFHEIKKKLPKSFKDLLIKVYRKKKNIYLLNRKTLNRNTLEKKFINYLHHHNLSTINLVNKNSKYQIYNLENLFKDINIALKNNINYLNLSSEPIKASYIYEQLTKKKLKSNNAKIYEANMKSKYHKLWKSKSNYLYNKNNILKDLKKFYTSKE